ncbi:MAG TPA: cyclase family protein [Candidatus Dormibacteraeota bacterium]|nr:cyclase family protein [Candidatus Dormibacteraeota bacterium]
MGEAGGGDDRVLPEYDELPLVPSLGLRHAWGVFGPDDQLGTINLLSPDRVRKATGLVREGTVYNLVLPLGAVDPPFYGRDPLRHTVFRVDRNYWDDRLDNFFLQGASHWDGLRHVQAREAGFWGGRAGLEPTPGPGPLGIEHWVCHGIVGRGVLLDLTPELESASAGYDPFTSCSVPAQLLERAAHRQGVEVGTGDILCVRTGWMTRYRGLDEAGRRAASSSHDFVGLAADETMARWLWNRHLAAIACDNPAVEVSPGDRTVGSLHRRLLPLLGFALGEFFDFDALARACAEDGRWEFLFVSVPLYLPGGVGSPANAIAVR